MAYGITQEQIDKLCRKLGLAVPVCTRPLPVVVGCKNAEFFSGAWHDDYVEDDIYEETGSCPGAACLDVVFAGLTAPFSVFNSLRPWRLTRKNLNTWTSDIMPPLRLEIRHDTVWQLTLSNGADDLVLVKVGLCADGVEGAYSFGGGTATVTACATVAGCCATTKNEWYGALFFGLDEIDGMTDLATTHNYVGPVSGWPIFRLRHSLAFGAFPDPNCVWTTLPIASWNGNAIAGIEHFLFYNNEPLPVAAWSEFGDRAGWWLRLSYQVGTTIYRVWFYRGVTCTADTAGRYQAFRVQSYSSGYVAEHEVPDAYAIVV